MISPPPPPPWRTTLLSICAILRKEMPAPRTFYVSPKPAYSLLYCDSQRHVTFGSAPPQAESAGGEVPDGS